MGCSWQSNRKTTSAALNVSIKSLKGKIILGTWLYPTNMWQIFSKKLTNLNVFSGMLPLPLMQKRTKGDEVCLEEGDYLAWSEIQWDLRGRADIEKIRKRELDTNPAVNRYSAQFQFMECKHFCENLGTQMPSTSKAQDFCEE